MARFTGQASSVNPVRRIAIATAKGADDVDMPLLINALGASDISAEAIEWDADRNWHAFDMVLVRSTWDYPWRVENFSAWIDHVSHSTLLVNPSEVIRWNLNKCYLCDLDRAGLPVIPTRYVKRVERPELLAGEIVVKPVVSASAWNTARYLPDAQAEAIEHIRMLHSQGVDAMVQPYLKQIEVMGERRLIFFNNRLSHAVRRGAVLHTSQIHNEQLPRPQRTHYSPSRSELAIAAAALRAVPGICHPLPYARVDLVPGSTGGPMIMELELIEPNLSLITAPGAVDRFAKALTEFASASPVRRSQTSRQKDSDGT